MKYLLGLFFCITLVCPKLLSAQTGGAVLVPKQIPSEIVRMQTTFNRANSGHDVPVDVVCQQIRMIESIAYPNGSSQQAYPRPRDPNSMGTRAQALAETAYAKAWANAEQILSQNSLVSIDLDCDPAPANNECCRRGSTRDYCDPSTGKKCNLDGYNWCSGSYNVC